MVTIARIQRLNPPLAATSASVAAIAGGLSAGIACLAMPTALVEQLLSAFGIARPSLGVAARIALALALGGGFAGSAWLALRLFGGRRFDFAKFQRRGDIHPDAPPRPPLLAGRDLGTPFLEVTAANPAVRDSDHSPLGPDLLGMTPVEQALPVDLNQPMGAFDPGALLAQPLAASEAVAPLAPQPEPASRTALIDPGDRIETFELTPVGRPEPQLMLPAPRLVSAAQSVVAPQTENSVHDLLARLERGISGSDTPPRPASIRPAVVNRPPVQLAPTGSLASTLGDVRRLAVAR